MNHQAAPLLAATTRTTSNTSKPAHVITVVTGDSRNLTEGTDTILILAQGDRGGYLHLTLRGSGSASASAERQICSA
jgi:hypothetical protein